MKPLRGPLVLLLTLQVSMALQAQRSLERKLAWPSLVMNTTPGAIDVAKGTKSAAATGEVEPFPGADLDMERQGLPIYSEVLPLRTGTTQVSVFVRDARYAPLTPAEREAWPASAEAGAEPAVTHHLSWYRKEPNVLVTVEPFRRNAGTGEVEKLVGFRFEFVETVSAGGGVRTKSYPAHSKLSTGEWYRITVPKDGVYKLTYDLLDDLGVNVNDLASDRINLYGNHFGLLPFKNNIPRATDLLVNAIEVVDGGDGVFSPGDYILFYATGPQRWDLDDSLFTHTKNVFTDSASYFIGLDIEDPVRIQAASLSQDSPTRTVTRFNDRQMIDRDLVNLIKSGRTWYGEVFDLTTTYAYNFDTPNLVSSEPLVMKFSGAARTLNSGIIVNYSSFTVSSGAFTHTISVQGVANIPSGPLGRNFNETMSWSGAGANVPVTVTFNKFDPLTSVGWMNFLELNCVRELRMAGDQLAFRDLSSVGPGEVAEFVLDQAQTVQRIWEITDPTQVRRVDHTTSGSQKSFRVATDTLRQFIAFRDANYLTPTGIGRVPNQDLHGTELPTDLVIVCPPEFQPYAVRLADRRASEGLSVRMVTPQQIFNEFSSGARDATAIKRYMRLLYDRATTPEEMPRYLLLFGDGSYNNFALNFSNQNWIPTYQTENAIDFGKSYTSDDYFGLLDENEGDSTADLVDIGTGRLIVHTEEQANQVVDKLLTYDRLQLLTTTGTSCTTTGDGGIADWRTHVLFVSDDQEGDIYEGQVHLSQSDFLATRVDDEHPYLNVEKLYLDAYQQVTTPGGERYPQAIEDLRDKVQKGLLVVNYVGHGGEVGWAHERLLDNTTILGWTNKDRLPLFMTATCEFSRWDDPGRTSAGEWVLLNPDGGGIGLMTTTRLAYSSQNFTLAQHFYDYVFEPTDELGRDRRLGDTYRQTKRAISAGSQGSLTNHRNFTLLGDPSMRLALPRNTLHITSITDTLGGEVDTLKALSVVRVSGFVDDGSGQPMTDFNGVVVPIVYDKAQEQFTLANDGGDPFDFLIRKSIIYRGRASVTAGQFSFTFIVPKDINYEVGPGRIACYAESTTTNAAGYDNEPLVGGTSSNVALDEQGPQIDLYLNDELFVAGGITNEDPLLFAKLYDANGINTVGSSIGHDLLATLDENTEQAIVLNDLYESDLNTFRSGTVRYRFADLAEGGHTLRLKAWDAFNNSAETTTDFVVAPSAELALAHVLNYPNPFTTSTRFFFEHNRPCNTLNVQVQVFTIAGRLVKTINEEVTCDGFRGEPLAWDGRDDFGDKLGRGVYVYRLAIYAGDGGKAEKYEKLVILR